MLPFTPSIGMRVGWGPWRVIVSQEGSRKKLWKWAAVWRMLRAGLCEWRDGILTWRPRFYKQPSGRWDNWDGNPSTTVWRRFPRTRLSKGVEVRMRMRTHRDHSLPGASYSEAWEPTEDKNNLRRVAGTGDFRIALLQTDGRYNTGVWHAYQVRVYPYLHRDAKNHIGANDTSNCSHWYRQRPGGQGRLIDDYSQEDDMDGFKKLRHKGELKFPMGPHSPYDDWVDVCVYLERRDTDGMMHPEVRVHLDRVQLDPYEHKTDGFNTEFEFVDAIAISFNNMRPYGPIEIACDWN